MATTPAVLIDAWVAGEAGGDTDALAPLLHPDFRGIGPHGFVLDRAQWLARFDHPFTVDRLVLDRVEVDERADTALVVGVQDQVATYRGHPSAGRFRLSLVAVREPGTGWTARQAHLSGPLPDGAPA